MAELELGSPAYWLKTLGDALRARQPIIRRLDEYYRGEHPLEFASEKFRAAFGGLFEEFADNWCDLVVDAVEERLNVEGFRFSDGEDAKGDEDAWRIWQTNNLDSESQLAHLEALIAGESYGLVWPSDDPKTPRITIEHASQMIVAPGLSNHRARAAALKRYIDEDSFEVAYLYLPDTVYRFRSRTRNRQGNFSASPAWVPEDRPNASDPADQVNPFGKVPVVPLVNRPRLLGARYRGKSLGLGESELRKVIPLQDAVNKLVADLMVSSEFGAFRQRWATGIEVPVDPDTKEPIEPFKAAVDRLWIGNAAEDSDVEPKFGEFDQTDLRVFVAAIEMFVQHVASQSRTPPHYFYLSGNFPSGESIKSAETGLVSKAKRKARYFGEGWEDIERLAFYAIGDKAKANFVGAETIWADPETRTESEHVDAISKKAALGVPQEQLWEDLGYSPTQIARFKGMQQRQAAMAAAAGLGLADLFNIDGPPAPAPTPPAPANAGA